MDIKGTKIKLVPCDVASRPYAQNLSNIAEAPVIAPEALTKYLDLLPQKQLYGVHWIY